jgi:Coenzyme PQQ synthesis protein D (PqqD)
MPFRINAPAIAHQAIAGEMILINLENGTYYSVRGSGAAILELVERGADRAGIVAALEVRHPAEADRVGPAVSLFLDTLLQEGLIRAHDAPDRARPAAAADDAIAIATAPFDDPQLEKYTDLKDLLFLDPVHEVTDAGWRTPER